MSNGKKSGDSKLQDAELARKAEREGEIAGEDRSEHLIDELQDSVEAAKANGASSDDLARIEKMLSQLTGIVEASQKRIVELEAKGVGKVAGHDLARRVACGTCGQYATACGGKHVTIRVLPDNPENLATFPGVRINGVTYFGTCVVGTSMADDILSKVQQFEWAQKLLQHNRGKVVGWSKDMQTAELRGNMARIPEPLNHVG